MNWQYKSEESQLLIAYVHVSIETNKIIVYPREKSNRNLLRAALRHILPDTSFSMSGGGIVLTVDNAAYLLDNPTGLSFQWSIEARQFVENQLRVRRVYEEVKNNVDALKKQGRPLAEDMLEGINISVLDDHQVVNVAAMTIEDGFGLCVFDEQGAGKTVTTIFAYDVLVERDEVDIALIIAPKSMVGEWPKDIKKFKGDLYKVITINGTASQKRKALSSGSDIFITNYETAVNLEEELTTFLRSYQGRSILIVDESFFVKNQEAKRTQCLRRIREWCRRAYVLCGTPAPNSPVDLVQQFDLVDIGVTFNGIKIPDNRIEAIPIVRQRINERGLYVRHLKQNVLPDLPGKKFHTVLIPLAKRQKEIYTQALQGYIEDLRSVSEKTFKKQLTHFFAQRSALLQICSNPNSLVRDYDETPAKLLALDEILNELIYKRGEKVVLWSFYRTSLETLVNRYKNYNPVRYDGTVSSVEERQNAVHLFQEDPSINLFIGNPAAAGAGLTLHRARYAIYESFSDQASQYLQSLDRIHRRGQEKEVEYIILLADQTLEVKQYESLQTKDRSARDLLGDNLEDPPSQVILLAEAINAAKLLNLDV
ncbi:DEAD/DEAH box helicase [Priestia aryabhattai]|uniref:DEAD/DEAH box helicase n=1 Tax=Priestia aryabhattai TaxID=412384 RepID=UPI003D2717E9